MTNLYLAGLLPLRGRFKTPVAKDLYEIVYPSVHWLPAYTNTAFAMLSNTDPVPCGCGKLGLCVHIG